MKKLLAILLSAMLVFSMVACSNDTPSPQAPVETPTELDKINDKLDSASSAFEDAENIEETIDESTGTVTQTIKKAVSMDGYTITSGKKTVSKDGLTASTALTIEYEENGQNVQIQDTQSEMVTVRNADGSDVSLEEEEIKEVTAAALTTAKEIPASQFVRTGENEYTYTPASTMARLARTGESVSSVVISFKYEDSKAVYTYEVTYITAGNTLTVTQEVTKETKKSVWDEEKKDYVMTNEANEEIKNNLMNDFSLGNLQPGGNSFYREEALDAAYILYRYADNPNDYIEQTDASLSLKTASGKEIAFTIKGFDDTTENDKTAEDGGTYTETVTDVNQTITVNAFNLQGIPILSDYIAKGDTITLNYNYSDFGSLSSNAEVDITVVSSENVEKLAIVMTDNATNSHNFENGVRVSQSNSTGTIKITTSGSILIEGTVEIDNTYSSEMIEENEPYGTSLCKDNTTSIFNFTTFDVDEIKELFGVSADEELTEIRVDQKSEYKSIYEGQSFDEISSTTIYVNKTPVDFDGLLSNLVKLFDGVIDFLNDGLSLEFNNSLADGGAYTFDYYVYNTETGSFPITVGVSSRSDTVKLEMNLKRGVVDNLISLFKEMMSGSGEMPNVNPNNFGSGNMNNISKYRFEDTFFGAKNVTFTVNSPSTAAMPTYTIDFEDGYMKGSYSFSQEELENSNQENYPW